MSRYKILIEGSTQEAWLKRITDDLYEKYHIYSPAEQIFYKESYDFILYGITSVKETNTFFIRFIEDICKYGSKVIVYVTEDVFKSENTFITRLLNYAERNNCKIFFRTELAALLINNLTKPSQKRFMGPKVYHSPSGIEFTRSDIEYIRITQSSDDTWYSKLIGEGGYAIYLGKDRYELLRGSNGGKWIKASDISIDRPDSDELDLFIKEYPKP